MPHKTAFKFLESAHAAVTPNTLPPPQSHERGVECVSLCAFGACLSHTPPALDWDVGMPPAERMMSKPPSLDGGASHHSTTSTETDGTPPQPITTTVENDRVDSHARCSRLWFATVVITVVLVAALGLYVSITLSDSKFDASRDLAKQRASSDGAVAARSLQARIDQAEALVRTMAETIQVDDDGILPRFDLVAGSYHAHMLGMRVIGGMRLLNHSQRAGVEHALSVHTGMNVTILNSSGLPAPEAEQYLLVQHTYPWLRVIYRDLVALPSRLEGVKTAVADPEHVIAVGPISFASDQASGYIAYVFAYGMCVRWECCNRSVGAGSASLGAQVSPSDPCPSGMLPSTGPTPTMLACHGEHLPFHLASPTS